MKKLSMLLLIAVLLAGSVFANGANEQASSGIADKIAKGQTLSEAELIALAKEESGDFIAYGNSSRIKNA